MNFAVSLRSEFLKIKRTAVLYLVPAAAAVVPLVLVFDHGAPAPGSVVNGWDHFYREGFAVFMFLFMPFYYILVSTLLLQIEVRNHAWKQVLAAPQSVAGLLLAKYVVMQVLAVAFVVLFNAYMVMSCAVIDAIYGVNLMTYLERWPELLKVNLMALGSTVGISGLSFWLALRFGNFIAPVGFGLLLWLIGPTAALELKWAHFDKYVFVLPFTILSDKFGHGALFYQMVSVGYGMFFGGIAYVEFVQRRL